MAQDNSSVDGSGPVGQEPARRNLLNVLTVGTTGLQLQAVTANGNLTASKAVVVQLSNAGNTAVLVSLLVPGYPGNGTTLCTLEPGDVFTTPWAPLARALATDAAATGGSQVGTVGYLNAQFTPARRGWKAGNLVLVVRRHLEAGNHQRVNFETIRQSGELVPNAYAFRLFNRGLNVVLLNDVPVAPGESLDIGGEPGYNITHPFKLLFNDSTNGVAFPATYQLPSSQALGSAGTVTLPSSTGGGSTGGGSTGGGSTGGGSTGGGSTGGGSLSLPSGA